jgi:hypothetical protein
MIIIIGGYACLGHVAVTPASCMVSRFNGLLNTGENNAASKELKFTFERINLSEAVTLSAPPLLYPWMVPYMKLNDYFLIIISCIENPGTEYENPYIKVCGTPFVTKDGRSERLLPTEEYLPSFESISRIHAAFAASPYNLSLDLQVRCLHAVFDILKLPLLGPSSGNFFSFFTVREAEAIGTDWVAALPTS